MNATTQLKPVTMPVKSYSPLLIAATMLLLIVSETAWAVKPIYSGGRDRAAIKGYDPVAYFTENKPVKGSKEISIEYKGAKWLFSSEENKNLFEANPEKYEPQFGGYCAYAVSQNTTASIKPDYFTIHEGKLYLNFSKSVNKRWLKDREGYIEEAEKNWPAIRDK